MESSAGGGCKARGPPATIGLVAEGKKLLDTLPMEKKGVRAVQAIFEDAGYTFQEVKREYDIGKDAYVDLREADDLFVGSMIALQIKSGPSFRQGEDFKINCTEKDRAIWAGSTIPIYGMVYDPDDNTVRWVNLTDWARTLRPDQTKSYCLGDDRRPGDRPGIETRDGPHPRPVNPGAGVRRGWSG